MRYVILILFGLLSLPAVENTTSGNWSNPETWGGTLPTADEAVHIAGGTTVVLDTTTPALGGVMVHGVLQISDSVDTAITADWIMVMGHSARYQAGSEESPLVHRHTITLTGVEGVPTPGDSPFLGPNSKFLMAMHGGTIRLHGASRDKLDWTVLDGSLQVDATTLTLAEDPVGWQVGDQIGIGPTGFDWFQYEKVTITGVSGREVSFEPAIRYPHWGETQTFAGRTVDARAPVGMLSRNIVVQGDEASDATGFGAHCMIMPGSRGFAEGVEFRRAGQRGIQARYPWHWHLTDRLSDSSFSAVGQYMRHCSVVGSFQRAGVIHGTSNIMLSDNVAFDIQNHAFVVSEDGDEFDNTARRNLVIGVRLPENYEYAFPDGVPTDQDSNSTQNEDQSSGFWLVNPHQTIIDNHVAGVELGNGIFVDNEDVGEAFAEFVEPLRYRVEISGNTIQSITSIHGFFSHMYNRHSGHGVMVHGMERAGGWIDISGNTFSKCMGSGAWMDDPGLFADNIVLDSTAATHALHTNQVRNLVVGYTANKQGISNPPGNENTYRSDDASLRPASGYNISHAFAEVVMADSTFINLNDAGVLVVDGMTWSTASHAWNLNFIDLDGTQYSRDKININPAGGALFDHDGSLVGVAESLLTQNALSGASVEQAAAYTWHTPIAHTDYFRLWISSVRDGDVIESGQEVTLNWRNLPTADAAYPLGRTMRLRVGDRTLYVDLPPGTESKAVALPPSIAAGWAEMTVQMMYNDIATDLMHRVFVQVANDSGQVPDGKRRITLQVTAEYPMWDISPEALHMHTHAGAQSWHGLDSSSTYTFFPIPGASQ